MEAREQASEPLPEPVQEPSTTPTNAARAVDTEAKPWNFEPPSVVRPDNAEKNHSGFRASVPFDVASIKANHSGSGSVGMRTSHGTLTVSNVTLRTLIQKGCHVKDSQISGGPAWLDTERYDIAAKTERTDISDERLWLSLQPLLADRFRLRFHRETKQLPIYSLIVAKGAQAAESRR